MRKLNIMDKYYGFRRERVLLDYWRLRLLDIIAFASRADDYEVYRRPGDA